MLLALIWTTPVTTQYDTCSSGDVSWVGNGYCDDTLNNEDCEYDGGDCCECTCVDGPTYICGHDGFRCEDPTCLDPNFLAEFLDCGGNLLRVNDGACDAYNNNEECAYDGGDCCLCTCIEDGKCGFDDFDCVDPSAEEGLYQCQPPPPPGAPCAVDIQRTWVVEDSTQARALAESVNCSGGTFDVLWKGFVTVERTIYVSSGTVITITGVGEPSTAVMHGGLQTRILTAINASLHMINVSLSSGSSVFGGAIAASASNMTFTRTSFVDNRASGMGGAIYMENHSTVLFDVEANISRNSAVGFGGALYACGNSSVTFTVEKAHILHNAAGESGGAIAMDQCHIWWSGKTFYGNNTSGYLGGAVNVANGSTIRWFGSHFFWGNTATWGGGALAVYLKSHVSWSGDMAFEYNRAVNIGGAMVVNGAGISWDGNTEFTFNMASNAGGALSAISGADVSWCGDTTFKDNRATSSGGAIYVDNAGMSWSGISWFFNNSAEAGGAVHAASGSFVRWNASNTIFALNLATVFSGGAVSIVGSNMSWTGNTTFEYNLANQSGGAVFVDGADLSWSGETSFKDNQANRYGGAIIVVRSVVSWSSMSSFFSNSAKTGGAIFSILGSSVRWSSPFTIFAFNTATIGGGGVVIFESNMSWSGNTTFQHNQADTFGGGAVYVAEATLSWSGDTIFEYNRAPTGGAVSIQGSRVTWDGSTEFVSNSASHATLAAGGALMALVGANVSWSGVTLFYNNSAMAGGAVYIIQSSNVAWTGLNTSFISNTATSTAGGALLVVKSHVWWSGDTTFKSNRANRFGGAIYTLEAELSWVSNMPLASGADQFPNSTTLFFKNSGTHGGAMDISLGSNVSWSGLSTMFMCNRATQFGGGAIAVNDSNLSWSGITIFLNNSAAFLGGGVFAYTGANVNWRGDTMFVKNNALIGGAVYLYQGLRVKWTGQTTFSSNEAGEEGGAVASTVSVTSTDGDSISLLLIAGVTDFVDNVSGRDGGAISLVGGLFVEIEPTAKVSFRRNYARVSGGAIFMSGVDVGLTFRGVTFASNSAQFGGGVHATSSGNAKFGLDGKQTFNPTIFDGCSFLDNTAIATGGAIQSAAGQDLIISTYFIGNTARAGGALFLAGIAEFFNCSFFDNEAEEGEGPAISNIGYVESMQNSSFTGNAYNCAPGTFRAFDTSGNLYQVLCVDCDALCEWCYFGNNSLVPYCENTMSHSISNGSATTIETISIRPGYWRATSISKNVLPCYVPDACRGGVTGTSSYCQEGYEGPYCSICSDGYTRSLGYRCEKCSTSSAGLVLLTVVVTAAVIAIIFLARYMMSGEHGHDTRRGFVEHLMCYVPIQSIKIVIVAWQILTQFASVANVTYPNVYQRFLDGVKVLEFDLSWIFSVSCVVNVDFHGRLLFATLGPIAVVVMLGMTYTVAAARNRRSDAALTNVRHKHVSAALLLAFLVYSSVSSILFQTFSCESLDDGKTYLRADYRIYCDSQTHVAYTVFAGFMTVLYTLGIPALYACLLFKDRHLLANKIDSSTEEGSSYARENNQRLRATSNLWKPYKPKRFYYELIEYGRRILLTGVVVFIYPNTAAQIAITLAIAFTFAMIFEGLNPYASTWDRWVGRMGHVVVYVSVYLALLLKVDVSEEQSESQKVFEVILVVVHGCMVMAILGEALALTCSLRTERREDPFPRFRRMKWIHGSRNIWPTGSEVVRESKVEARTD